MDKWSLWRRLIEHVRGSIGVALIIEKMRGNKLRGRKRQVLRKEEAEEVRLVKRIFVN